MRGEFKACRSDPPFIRQPHRSAWLRYELIVLSVCGDAPGCPRLPRLPQAARAAQLPQAAPNFPTAPDCLRLPQTTPDSPGCPRLPQTAPDYPRQPRMPQTASGCPQALLHEINRAAAGRTSRSVHRDRSSKSCAVCQFVGSVRNCASLHSSGGLAE